jgi:ribosomal protein S18 acetylase RimI-like enzyme
MIRITTFTARSVSRHTLADLSALILQLRGEKPKVTQKELSMIARDTNIVVMVAKDGTRIVGVATLYVLKKIGKRTAQVEDVVVDDGYRGRGLGEKLMEALIVEAKKRNVRTVSLTSRPARIAANKLYQKIGFERRETNVYRLKL